MRQLIASTAIVFTLPFAANAYTAKNRLTVAPVENSAFEVVGRAGGTGPRDYWCAAGEYAFSQGARGNSRVYLVSGPQPSVSNPGRTAVRYTLTPEAAGVSPISPELVLSVDVPGDNLSVASAREFCTRSISRL